MWEPRGEEEYEESDEESFHDIQDELNNYLMKLMNPHTEEIEGDEIKERFREYINSLENEEMRGLITLIQNDSEVGINIKKLVFDLIMNTINFRELPVDTVLSTVFSSSTEGSILSCDSEIDCVLGTLALFFPKLNEDEYKKLVNIIERRANSGDVIGIPDEGVKDLVSFYGNIKFAELSPFEQIKEYGDLDRYIRSKHEQGNGGIYIIYPPGASTKHSIALGIDLEGNLVLIDRQNNHIIREYSKIKFINKEIWEEYLKSYCDNCDFYIQHLLQRDITDILTGVGISQAMDFDER